jgi:hypothetical protein
MRRVGGMGNLGYTIMMIGVFVGLTMLLRAIQYLTDRYRWGAGDPESRSSATDSPETHW